jgi:DNA-directed RNA polymerase specialized sigma24 family protein
MNKDLINIENKEEFRLLVTQTYTELVRLKKNEDKTSFNEYFMKITPKIRKYIDGRLITAILKGHFSKNKYKADDIIDQLFIEIYDHIDEIKDEKEFYLWLFKKTNELLEDIEVEEEFDDYFFKNIDEYTKPEWDELQEKYSTDGDGDFVMLEEFDDPSYNHHQYTLNHVFIEDNEKALIAKIDKDLSSQDLKNHIRTVLINLPFPMRHVFELATHHHLELEEIGRLTNRTVKDVKKLLKQAKDALQISLFNRYPAR